MLSRSLFIFRRDLRLDDNIGLLDAVKNSKEVIPIFILDPRQVEEHPYRSLNAQQFLFESLKELNQQLIEKNSCLNLLFGQAEEVIDNLLVSHNATNNKIEAVFFNRDYTPFSNIRDEAIYKVCQKHSVKLVLSHDALLTEPQKSLKDDGKPYTVFTPFFKKNSKSLPPKTIKCVATNFSSKQLSKSKDIEFLDKLLPQQNPNIFIKGGRKEGLTLINKKVVSLTNYNDQRNLPAMDGTSGLSAHHKFGTVSIRETFWKAKECLSADNNFISELYWRDFFTCIGYFFPHVYGKSFHSRYDALIWDEPKQQFSAWCNGLTGFPIVDAGMRQLNQTGWMHNRVRMIVASFLIKDLHIDWRIGEKYFAQKLIDYDPAVNNGSWQWAASTGCDAQPYFRIFNPKLQQEKFDSNAEYIKFWIPELKQFTAKQIHSFENTALGTYPKPIIEHASEKKETERRYSTVVK